MSSIRWFIRSTFYKCKFCRLYADNDLLTQHCHCYPCGSHVFSKFTRTKAHKLQICTALNSLIAALMFRTNLALEHLVIACFFFIIYLPIWLSSYNDNQRDLICTVCFITLRCVLKNKTHPAYRHADGHIDTCGRIRSAVCVQLHRCTIAPDAHMRGKIKIRSETFKTLRSDIEKYKLLAPCATERSSR